MSRRTPSFRRLSERDTKVHEIVGEQTFKTLTNSEIMKSRGLHTRFQKECKLEGGDAAKSCLDRIRKALDYPLSRKIAEKRSSQK
jgi:hypothetical protein